MADKHANMPGMSGQPKKPEQGKAAAKPQQKPKSGRSDEAARHHQARHQPKSGKS